MYLYYSTDTRVCQMIFKKKRVKMDFAKKYYKYQKSPTSSDPEGVNGFFKAAYRYYFLLDVPPEQAFAMFCRTARAESEAEAIEYLVVNGDMDRERIEELWSRNLFDARENLADKYEYLLFLIRKGE